jgi:copper chaperone CopZ
MHAKLSGLGLVVLLGAALIFCCGKSNERAQTEKKAEAVAADVQKVKLGVEGMTCSGCAFGVETALKNVAGVKQAEVRFDEKSAEVEFDPTIAKVDQLVEAVSKAGFKAKAANLN